MKKRIILLLSLLISIKLFAQNKISIEGFVKEKKTEEAIIDANVFILETNARHVTDNNGHFVLYTMVKDNYTIVVSKVGFKSDTIRLNNQSNHKILIELTPKTNDIKNVVIKASTQNKTGASLVEIPMNKIKLLPQLGGEVDVLKSYQLMPGIQGGAEGSSGLYVRGGSPDQNLILIDDVPVYNVSHLGGFLSILDVNAVNKLSIIKGGFPARYGGRLSSVVDVRMKEGTANGFNYSYNLGLLSSKFFVEGNYKHKTRFMFSARRFNLDIPMRILSSKQNNGEINAGYSFYDLYAKITHVLNEKNKLSLFAYNGRDNIFLRQNFLIERQNELFKFKSNVKWGNTLVGLKLVQQLKPHLVGNATLSYTRYKYSTNLSSVATNNSTKEKLVTINENYNSQIVDLTAKYDLTYFPNDKMQLKTGIAFVNKTANPSQKQLSYQNDQFTFDTLEQEKKILTKELIGYVENEQILTKKIKLNYGVHLLNFFSNQKFIVSFQPRLLLTYTEDENFNVNLGYSKMTQNLHLLTNNNAGLPTDLWVPATINTLPSNCHQISVSSNYRFNDKRFQLTTDIYYKRYNNLIEFKDGINFTNFRNDWETKIEKNGVGNATGLELLLEKKEGRFNGWIGYTLAYNYRKFENINDGKYFPYKYDRRHSLSVVGNYSLKKNIAFSFSFVANTGSALTMPVGSYPTPLSPFVPSYINYNSPTDSQLYVYHNGNTFIYKGRNSSRMPLYHRLDISFTFHKELKKGTRDWVISVYNIYNKQNPYFYYFEYTNQKDLHLYQITLFPIIPSISYNRNF